MVKGIGHYHTLNFGVRYVNGRIEVALRDECTIASGRHAVDVLVGYHDVKEGGRQ